MMKLLDLKWIDKEFTVDSYDFLGSGDHYLTAIYGNECFYHM